MPKAMLLVKIVVITTLSLGSGENAEPMMTPSTTNVESKTVLMKNLRIAGPVSGVRKAERIADSGPFLDGKTYDLFSQ
jgi:hypothetical protein